MNTRKNHNNTPLSHDNFVRKSLSDKKIASEFFETHLPKEILSQVDLSTLEQQKENYFDNTLGHGIVDLLYSVKFGQDDGYIALLLEHQSTVDYKMPLRIQKYVLRICEDYLTKNDNAKIPLIYPLIFYTGDTKYNASLSFYSLFNNSELAKRFLTEPIQLIETNGFTKEDIRERYYAGLMTYFMAHIRQKDIFPYIKEVIEFITRISEQGNIEFIETILYYLTNKADTEKIDGIFSEFKKAVTLEHKEDIMTIAERLEQRGKEAGIQIGKEAGIQIGEQRGKEAGIRIGLEKVAANMLIKNLDEKVIAESTGLSLEEIKKLRKN